MTSTHSLLLPLLVASFRLVAALEGNTLKVHVATWNVAEARPLGSLEPLLGVEGDQRPDLVVVGLQEVTMKPVTAVVNFIYDSDKWTETLERILGSKGYYKVETVRLVGLLLNVFVLYEHRKQVYGVESAVVRTGLWGTFGNKGAVLLHLTLYGSQLCLVNAHMAAHDDKLAERLDQYRTINSKRSSLCNLENDSLTLWFGDLNFRLNDPWLDADKIVTLVKKNQLEGLLQRDQLARVMDNKQAFHGFKEAPITFKPTFKFVVGTDEYNRKRRPAWTDRILYQAGEGVLRVERYESLRGYDTSDHKPVTAGLSLTVPHSK